MTILVVDDEDEIRELIREFLERRGFRALAAASADAAWQFLETEKVSVILSDIRMPGASGLDLLRRVREGRPALPVVLMSAFADVTRDEARRQGAAEFISKPFDPDRLVDLIRTLLGA